ncbi:MAG: hypothetical protein H6937_13490 [Burkholderiales bacterium]|nr:hypothetical protein [Burkholderiales bacterium]
MKNYKTFSLKIFFAAGFLMAAVPGLAATAISQKNIAGGGRAALSGAVDVSVHMGFEKISGLASTNDISCRDIPAKANDKVVITPDGSVYIENNNVIYMSRKADPGEIKIQDGRAQQFRLMASGYMSNGVIKPVNALCSLGDVENISCDEINSVKGKEEKTLRLGMLMRVIDVLKSKEIKTQPSFDLSVVYF